MNKTIHKTKIAPLLILLILLVLTLTSCNHNRNSNTNSPGDSNPTGIGTVPAQSVDLVTSKNYKTNDEIEIGNNSNIILKQGVLENKVYWRNNINILGADSSGNIITFNGNNSNVESIDSTFKLSVLLNLTGERKNHIFAIEKCGDIIAWSECPRGNEDPATDTTKGAGWQVYYANLKTKKITKIDEDKGVTVPAGAQYGYLCPNQVFAFPDQVCYISYDRNPDGQVTAVINLYTISSGKLEKLDYLNEDLSKYTFGYPSVSDGKMVWCKAQVNPDGTYTGFSYLYDINTKVKTKLVTDENVINPIINGNYIFAQGLPNITFYDSEVCIYDISKNQWVYKINNGYSQYKNKRDIYLTQACTIDDYLLWSTPAMKALVLFNKADNKLYNIVSASEGKEITSPFLLDGRLLIWFERDSSTPSNQPIYRYILLK
jgi:hypothetical protein